LNHVKNSSNTDASDADSKLNYAPPTLGVDP
jgi:hypothetical protein